MLHAPDILHVLTGLRLAHPVYVYQQVGSTNDEAKRFADSGAPEGLLVVAEEQTAGRGRERSHWHTPPDSALAFSLVLRPALPADQAARLTMLAAVAACEAIEQLTPLTAQIKWPNDVLLSGKKVAGILLETVLAGDKLDYAIIGLGLNVSFIPENVDFPATSLQAEAGSVIDRLQLLRAILARLETHYPALLDKELFDAWRGRLALLDTPVIVRAPSGEYRGRAEGVAPDGALLFRADSGETLRLFAGDVHLRPA
jgi:BirA family biotin operon repressor/biotin-[acetyl-CoA-carboxylase] ligase